MIWEVFRQEREGQPFQHGGSLEAPNLAFAEAYAREFYGRRDESFARWIVPRDAVGEIREPVVAEGVDRGPVDAKSRCAAAVIARGYNRQSQLADSLIC